MERIKIIYIAGYGRSGSTLLERILGEFEGFFSAGELWLIWERSFLENQLCGCGKPFNSCDFWREVVEKAFGKISSSDVINILKLRNSVQKMRYIPFLLFPKIRFRDFDFRLKNYIQILSKLYTSIAKVASCNIIIDSSKVPLHAFVLLNLKNIELNVIHLVRHSCAVAYSWQRKKIRPEITNKIVYMPRYSSFKSAFEWLSLIHI